MQWRRNKKSYKHLELHPDEILLDVHNLPAFNTQQFEGRMERAIPKKSLWALFGVFLFVAIGFSVRLGYLQLTRAEYYQTKSEQNSLDHIPVFADRGVIYDRNGVELAWNSVGDDTVPTFREYIQTEGFASVLGYVTYPAKDKKGVLWQDRVIGKDGIERELDTQLAGQNGTQLIETNVGGDILPGSLIEEPIQGANVTLALDARVQETLFTGMKALALQSGYVGGAGAVLDIKTGELLALTSYPEFNQSVMSLGKDAALIKEYMQGEGKPFLNRMTEGLYTPGSIVKPFLGLAALQEGIIDPYKTIFSSGELRVPHPYNPGQFTIFKDNKAHGAVDMRHAIAVSSNIYFYQIGGGFGTQKGLGIANIEKYSRLFGIGEKTGVDMAGELTGVIPSVEWKAKRFNGDPWRIGDTYNTSIGQYGFQVTPIQMLRATASIASRGTLVTPTIHKFLDNKQGVSTELPFSDAQFSVIHDAMRLVVTEGTGGALFNSTVTVAAKTGTAQIKNNTRVNSWAIGFFPLEKPRYAFTVLMENGPKVSSGAAHAMKPVIQWFAEHPELFD